MFKYASLFSGIGGFEVALNKLGGHCVFASEIDTKTAFSYEVVHGIKPHGDITQIDVKEIPDHDLLVGGFPCQAFSIAGKQKGFEDTRGTLFFEIARIAKEKKPKVLLLENVKNLVSHDKGRTLEVVIRTISDLGYAVDFEVLNSKYFGVPQNRERVFIVGVLGGKTEPYKVKGNNTVAKAKKRLNKLGLRTFNFPYPSNDKVTTKLIDILEENVAEKYYIKEEKAKKLIETLKEKYQVPSKDLKMVGHLDMKGADCVKRVYDPSGGSPTLTTMGGGHREPKILEQSIAVVKNRGNLQQREVVNCIDANYFKGLDNHGQRSHILETEVEEVYALTERRTEEAKRIRREYRKKYDKDYSPRRGKELVPRRYSIGNCLTTSVSVEHWLLEKSSTLEVRPVLTPDRTKKRQEGRRFKEDGEPAFTLNTVDKHGVAIGRFPNYRIRKLTPLECFRLQGFPDEFYYKLKDQKISDTQLYKMAGNAVTVNVIVEIGEIILKEYFA